jgi:hypothetical protein
MEERRYSMDSIQMAKQKKIKPHQRINKQTDSNGMERVHTNTHYSSVGKAMELQWVISVPTLCLGEFRQLVKSLKKFHINR